MIDIQTSNEKMQQRPTVARAAARIIGWGMLASTLYAGGLTYLLEKRYSNFKKNIENKIQECPKAQNIAAFYDATEDDSTLRVIIPKGGSLSGASMVYFGDMHRWRADINRAENLFITNYDSVAPGSAYTFTK